MTSRIAQYIYETLRSQGWRVQYTHAAAEASYDGARLISLVVYYVKCLCCKLGIRFREKKQFSSEVSKHYELCISHKFLPLQCL